MVIGRSLSFSDPARPPGGGVGRPKHPKKNCACVLRPQEDVFAGKKISVTKNFHLGHKLLPLLIIWCSDQYTYMSCVYVCVCVCVCESVKAHH